MATTTGHYKDRMKMRRKVLMLSAACLAMMLPAHDATAQGPSPCVKSGFAFVSSPAILASIPEYLQGDSLVAKDVAAYKVELAKLQGAFDSASQAFAANSTLLGTAAKAAKIKQLEAQRDSIQRRQDDLSQKVQLRQQELLQPITVRVQAVLDGMRAELNCAVIFDVAGSGQGGLWIASADKSLDLTDRVIERLKSSATKPAAKPAGKPAPGIKPPGGGGDEPDALTPAQP